MESIYHLPSWKKSPNWPNLFYLPKKKKNLLRLTFFLFFFFLQCIRCAETMGRIHRGGDLVSMAVLSTWTRREAGHLRSIKTKQPTEPKNRPVLPAGPAVFCIYTGWRPENQRSQLAVISVSVLLRHRESYLKHAFALAQIWAHFLSQELVFGNVQIITLIVKKTDVKM